MIYLRKYWYVLVIVLLLLFIWWQRSEHQSEIVAHDKEILKQAQEREQKAIDSLRIINTNLQLDLERELNKPAVQIPKYYEKIIYIDVSDSTIIKSVTNATNRYRTKRQ
ncbi:hypothetical protein I5168_11865 [Nonlabens sp. SCSIO 43208]|uniref:hypothetical protein n=1 Tax=Nonlabens sp. SCSIO 43208 TaxID=2793009 RepID=UPI003D6BA2A9